MKKSVILVAMLLSFFSAASFAATWDPLNKEQVIKELQDKTIITVPLITLNGKLINNSATIYIGKDNQVKGQLSNKPKDSPQSDAGTWEVKDNGPLCVTWQNWNKKSPICVYAYKLKNGLVFVNAEDNKFETLVLKDNIKSGDKVLHKY